MSDRDMAALAERNGVGVVELHGLTFLAVDEAQFVDLIVSEYRAGRGGWAITPNIDIVRMTHERQEIRELVRSADVLVADGMPLIWASRIQKTPLQSRVCGSDLIDSIPRAAALEGLPVYFLGGADDTAERTARILTERYPGLRVAGTYAPPFGFEKQPSEFSVMSERIERAAPAIIFVALSFPKGEYLIQRIRQSQPNAWWVGVGAAFDFVSGAVKRAPAWMQQTGTEWLYRIIQEPNRLARRYLMHDAPFAVRLFAGAVRRRLGR